jgi:DNA-binding CsgD family transcriptional regulator
MSDDLRSTEILISEREREILCLVATGATNQEIAQQLHISINTVKKHLSNIFGKIGVESRTEATLYAVRAGLVAVSSAVPVGPALAPDDTESALADDDSELGETLAAQPPPAAVVLVPALPAPTEALGTSSTPEPVATPSPVTVLVPASRQPRPIWAVLLLLVLLAAGATWALLRPSANSSQAPTAENAAVLPETERLRLLAPLPVPLTNFALVNVNYDGKRYLYAIGGETTTGIGQDVLRYDIESGVWATFRAKPTPVSDIQAVVIGGKIYVPGGREADGSISTVLEVYDPQRDRWEALEPLLEPRSRYALMAVEGKLYLFGGWNGVAFSDRVWQYSPDTDRWEKRAPMLTARADAGAVEVNDQVFVIGGVNESGKLRVNERYNPAEDGIGNPWAVSPPLDAPRSNFGIASAGSLVFVFGGGPDVTPALIFNPFVESWQVQETAFDGARQGLRAQTVGDQIFIGGGRGEELFSDEFAVYQAIYSQVLPMR